MGGSRVHLRNQRFSQLTLRCKNPSPPCLPAAKLNLPLSTHRSPADTCTQIYTPAWWEWDRATCSALG